MDRFPDHKSPLWMERSDHTWGTHLTYTDLALEDLDDRPSRLPLLLAERTGRRAPDVAGALGVDTDVAPTSSAPGGKP